MDSFVETIMLVANNPGITGQEIAEKIGSNSWINKMLVQKGLLRIRKTETANKIRYYINWGAIRVAKEILQLAEEAGLPDRAIQYHV